MMESVRVMIDEQSKLTLKQFEESLGELLAPLKRLEDGADPADTASQGDAAVKEALKSLKAMMEDALDDLTRKVDAIASAQSEIFAKVAAVARAQSEMAAKPEAKPVVAKAAKRQRKSSAKKSAKAK